jgi:hypothetical protein
MIDLDFYTDLRSPSTFGGDDQDVIVPHHATLDAKARFFRFTGKHLPSPGVRGIVHESVATGDRQERAIVRYAAIPYRPLHSSVQRVDLIGSSGSSIHVGCRHQMLCSYLDDLPRRSLRVE